MHTAPRGSRRPAIVFAAVLCLFALYGGCFIYRTSFTVQGQRWFALFDDAMISMQYAKNLASGQGLVWNAGGERVEGFTNPLWTLFMAAIHLLPIPTSKVSAVVQITGLLLLLVNLGFVRALARRISESERVAWIAVVLTATYFPLNNWALQGTEVSLLAAWVTCGCWLLVRYLQERRGFPPLCILLGAGTLVRIDAAIPAATMALLAALVGQERWKKLGLALGIVGGTLLLQTLLRYVYYGEILPNTYHLKIAGTALPARLMRGGAGLLAFAAATKWVVCIPLALPFFRRETRVLPLLAVVAVQFLYSMYAGGDAWEWYGGSNRFVSIVMSVFMVLLAVCLHDLARLIGPRIAGRFQPTARRLRFLALPAAAACVAGMALLLNLHGGLGTTARRWALVDRPLYVDANRRLVRLALRLKEMTTGDATLAVVWAGNLPYFSDRSCVDLLGSSDRIVARGPVRGGRLSRDPKSLGPGYSKWDYGHSIGELKPDVIADTWSEMESSTFWASYYEYDLGLLGKVYPRIDSAKLRLAPEAVLASRLWSNGLSLESQRRWDEAIDLFRRAIETSPYNESWRYYLGAVLLEHRPLAEIVAYYDSTVSRDPKPQTSCYFRGAALARAGKHDEAVESFRRALEIDPAHELSQLMWGYVLATQGRLDEANEHYREAIRIRPDFSDAHEALAASLRRQGRGAEAEAEEARAARVDSNPARKYFYWGRYLIEHGRTAAAIAELERGVEADPDDPKARGLLERARQLVEEADHRGGSRQTGW